MKFQSPVHLFIQMKFELMFLKPAVAWQLNPSRYVCRPECFPFPGNVKRICSLNEIGKSD